MVIAHNYYYSQPGKEAEVLRQRLLASEVRVKLGLPRGRVLSRIQGDEDVPAVVWECEYPDRAAFERSLSVMDGSPEFVAVRDHMGTLITKFRRTLWEVCD
jgi:hypothetical protein